MARSGRHDHEGDKSPPFSRHETGYSVQPRGSRLEHTTPLGTGMSPSPRNYEDPLAKHKRAQATSEFAEQIAKGIGKRPMTGKTASATRGPEEKCPHLYSVVVPRTFEERLYRPSPPSLRGSKYGWMTVTFRYCPYCRLDLTKPLPRERRWLSKWTGSWFSTRPGRAYRKKFPEKVIDPYGLHDLF